MLTGNWGGGMTTEPIQEPMFLNKQFKLRAREHIIDALTLFMNHLTGDKITLQMVLLRSS